MPLGNKYIVETRVCSGCGQSFTFSYHEHELSEDEYFFDHLKWKSGYGTEVVRCGTYKPVVLEHQGYLRTNTNEGDWFMSYSQLLLTLRPDNLSS